MSEVSKIEPFRISFLKYTVNPQNLKDFENIFCDHLNFIKLRPINPQTCIYKNFSSYYLLETSDDISHSKIDAIGLHLKQSKKKKNDLDDVKIDSFYYAKKILEKSKFANPLPAQRLPLPGVDMGGIKFYFTTANDFTPRGIFGNVQGTRLHKNQQDNLDSLSQSGKKRDFIIYHHHVAFFNSPENIRILGDFFESDLGLKANNAYTLIDAKQHVKTFQLNQVRLNTIESIESHSATPVKTEDFYSHGALGTTNILDFASRITHACHSPNNQVEIVPMGGSQAKFHYESIQKHYAHILTSRQLEDIEKYQINFDADLENPQNCGFQFFFRSVLGLMEGIQTEGNFSFMPRAGEGVTQGINMKLGVS